MLAENPSWTRDETHPSLRNALPPSHALLQMSYPMAKLPPAARVSDLPRVPHMPMPTPGSWPCFYL